MNSSKKNRSIDALSRVRKRNSIGKPASSVSRNINASQKHASLLKNNQGLARTLQETRCELSLYKNFHEGSLEFINKAKHAKSRMAQVYDLFKTFLKTFEENLSLMDFDESKLPIIKPPVQSNKSFHMEMNPVPEATGELPADQEMNGDQQYSPSNSDALSADMAKSENPEHVRGSLRVKTDDLIQNQRASHSENVKGNETAGAEVPKKIGDLSDLQKCPPPTTLPSQADKVTRIPRVFGIRQEKQDSSNKRKSPEKASNEIVSDLLRRKTFVVKNNILTVAECTHKTDGNETEHMNCDKTSGKETVPPQLLISIADKRQTFVIKPKDALGNSRKRQEETASAATLINTVDDKVNVGETSDVQEDILENKKRKTFVKKPLLHQNGFELDVLEEPVTKTRVNANKSKDVQDDVLRNRKRKTFVKKQSVHQKDVLESQVSEEQVTKNRVNVDESKDVQDDVLQNKKRKSFVKKQSVHQNDVFESQVSEERVTKNSVNVDESKDMQDIVLQNKKRKTFVKKLPLHQNDALDCQTLNPNGERPSVNSETENHGSDINNLKSSNTLHKKHSETDHAAIKNKLVSVANAQDVANLITPNLNEPSSTTSKEMPSGSNASDKSEEMPENCNPVINNVDTVEVAIRLTDVMAEKITDNSPMDENNDKMNLKKNLGSFLDSSESGLMLTQQTIDFKEFEIPPIIQTTPIRRRITNSKRKKFIFSTKRRKTIVKKKSHVETVNSEKSENGSQESAGEDVINNNENDACVMSNANATSKEVANTGDVSNIPAVREKTIESPRKEDNRSKPSKINTEKMANKVKFTIQKNSSADIEVDVLSSQAKKSKRNLKKKKSGPVCFDEDKITKFVAERKPIKAKKVKKAIKELESDSSDSHMVQTGTNNSGSTWVVQADIERLPSSFCVPDSEEVNEENKGPDVREAVVLKNLHPPHSSSKVSDDEQMNKENKRLGLPHMQVAIVLDDILKSKNLEALNVSDNLLNVAFKTSLSRSISNIEIHADESIERLRSEPVHDKGDYAVQTDAILENSNPNVLADPVLGDNSPQKLDDIELIELDTVNLQNRRKKVCVNSAPVLDDDIELIDLDIENPRGRRRKIVSYKERPVNVKLRRN